MKPIFLAFLLFAMSHSLLAQKTISNPSFGATNVSYLKIRNAILSDTATILDFEAKPGMTFRIASESYLLQNVDSAKLMLKGSTGITLDKFITIKEHQTKFTLVFPPVNPATSRIDFSEGDCEGCFRILDIALRPATSEKVLPQELLGNWYATDGSKNWVLGVYDSIAIYKNEAWKYTSVKNGKKTIIHLERKGESKVLVAVQEKGNKGMVLTDQNQQVRLSHNKKGPLSSRFDEEYKSVFKSDSSVYRGFLGAYSPKLGFRTGQVFVNNNITGDQENYLITIDDQGNFYSKFPMHYPQQVFVRFPGEALTVYCEPGKETFQYYDLADDVKSQQFMGDCSLINEELSAASSLFGYNYDRKLTEVYGFTPLQYQQYLLSNGKRDLDSLALYKEKNHLSKKVAAYLEMERKFRTASDLFEYNWTMESAFRKANKVPDSKRGTLIKAVVLDSAYFDYVRTLPLNDEVAFIAGSYHGFINRIRFADIAMSRNLNLTLSRIVAGLKKEGTVFTAEDEQIIKLIENAEKTVLTDTIAAKKRDAELSKLVMPFNEKYMKSINAYVSKMYSGRDNDRLKSVFHLNDGLLTDVLYSQSKASYMKRTFTPLDQGDKAFIRNEIKNPFIASGLLKLDAEMVAKIEANKKKTLVINEVPDNIGDNVFASIIEKYKGKVVYVDFWATWCAPCMNGIKTIAPLKEEIKNENVVFLYITNQTSPLETYKIVIPDIKGEHYRVSTDQWNYLSTKFKISGIPHYVLVDKKGEVVDAHLPHLSNTELKTRIMALK